MLPLLVIAGIVAGGYLISLRVRPVRTCSRCAGTGKVRRPSGRRGPTCRRCKGAGGWVRIGRRVMDAGGRGARNL